MSYEYALPPPHIRSAGLINAWYCLAVKSMGMGMCYVAITGTIALLFSTQGNSLSRNGQHLKFL